jgi:hypothetical protein
MTMTDLSNLSDLIVRSADAPAPKIKPRVSWPWKDMGIGDQIKLPLELLEGLPDAQASAHVYFRQSGGKCTTRKLDDGSLMVLRTA